MVELCVNSNRSAVLESSATIYIPHESPMPQLNDDVFHIQLRSGDYLWE